MPHTVYLNAQPITMEGYVKRNAQIKLGLMGMNVEYVIKIALFVLGI